MWNYRGYGQSEGKPGTKAILRDVLEIYDFLKATGAQLIGTHGESLGGMAACHLGANREIKIMIVDRSFSSLLQVIQRTPFRCIGGIIGFFTGWNYDSAKAYLSSNSYKIITYDPKD